MVHDDTPTLFGFPLNRIVAFCGPYIAVLSGAAADWLLVHVHFLSLFHTTHTTVAGAITQVVVFGVTALLTWLGHQKWLDGYQAWAYGKNAPFPSQLAPPDGAYDEGEFADDAGSEPGVPPGLGS
jgi:hypothetical protein